MKKMETVKDLGIEMYSHEDVGLATQINTAISSAIEKGKITLEDELSPNVLGEIRKQIYENNRNPDPTTLLFAAMAGQTDNPVEAAIRHIDDLLDHTK